MTYEISSGVFISSNRKGQALFFRNAALLPVSALSGEAISSVTFIKLMWFHHFNALALSGAEIHRDRSFGIDPKAP
ncbi:hypothetical protein X765_30960 [Mesorhizobium sp. LSHC440B00]|nr:hypothetical protein X765_30960 [Mesorhizobium sp. LSHC440B00]ESX33265.1 hypothetical protein X764_29840 [Mesorhizobium sp. LSHC440A00]ESX34492.1 hypothetical protein X763_21400 [Mesorhizobium sp. LSHC432A00]